MISSNAAINIAQQPILPPTAAREGASFGGTKPSFQTNRPTKQSKAAGDPAVIVEQRGTLTDDPCLSVELSEGTCSACVWNEGEFDIKLLSVFDRNAIVHSVPATLSFVQNEQQDPSIFNQDVAAIFVRNSGEALSLYPVPLLGKNFQDIVTDTGGKLVITEKKYTMTVVENADPISDSNILVQVGKEAPDGSIFAIFSPQQLVSIILQYWVDAFRRDLVFQNKSTEKTEKKKRRTPLTVVVPSYFTARQRLAVIEAVSASGHTPRRVSCFISIYSCTNHPSLDALVL